MLPRKKLVELAGKFPQLASTVTGQLITEQVDRPRANTRLITDRDTQEESRLYAIDVNQGLMWSTPDIYAQIHGQHRAEWPRVMLPVVSEMIELDLLFAGIPFEVTRASIQRHQGTRSNPATHVAMGQIRAGGKNLQDLCEAYPHLQRMIIFKHYETEMILDGSEKFWPLGIKPLFANEVDTFMEGILRPQLAECLCDINKGENNKERLVERLVEKMDEFYLKATDRAISYYTKEGKKHHRNFATIYMNAAKELYKAMPPWAAVETAKGIVKFTIDQDLVFRDEPALKDQFSKIIKDKYSKSTRLRAGSESESGVISRTDDSQQPFGRGRSKFLK